MIFKRLLVCFTILFFFVEGHAQVIPNQMEYCGMKLSFTPAAKEKLAEYVNKIYESPRYYNQMVMKANTYMPFIEEAFRHAELPDDLKYIAIQESGLRANATSISQTVGFWQLSDTLARDLGLKVNEEMDERMHIFRSSQAVANHLANISGRFDNWVYTTIAYHEGHANTPAHTNPKYYGQPYMMIDDDLHWYALKVIAYKIAYHEALEMASVPNVWLEPVLAKGGSNLKKIYTGKETDYEEFMAYNLWLRTVKKLPKEGYYTVYLPQSKTKFTAYIEDPVYELERLTSLDSHPSKTPPVVQEQHVETQANPTTPNPYTPEPRIENPPSSSPTNDRSIPSDIPTPSPTPITIDAKNISELSPATYVVFELIYDLDYGIEYIEYDAQKNLLETANQQGIGFNHLININGLGPNEKPLDGTVLYLLKPSKVNYHIVKQEENIAQIAILHGKTVAFIQERNQMEANDFNVYIGQKLYLKKKKPKNEKIIVLRGRKLNKDYVAPKLEETKPIIDTPIQVDTEPATETSSSAAIDNEISYPVNSVVLPQSQTENQWVEHRVQEGETLEEISQQYNSRVEIIKQINKLKSGNLTPGTVLRILVKN